MAVDFGRLRPPGLQKSSHLLRKGERAGISVTGPSHREVHLCELFLSGKQCGSLRAKTSKDSNRFTPQVDPSSRSRTFIRQEARYEITT